VRQVAPAKASRSSDLGTSAWAGCDLRWMRLCVLTHAQHFSTIHRNYIANGTYDYTKWSPGMTTTGGDAAAAVSATAAGAEQLPVRPHQCGSALLRGRLLGRHAPGHHRLRSSRCARMSLTLPAFLLWRHIVLHKCHRALAVLTRHRKLKDGGSFSQRLAIFPYPQISAKCLSSPCPSLSLY
jgi:hypothetical protein